MRGDYLATNCDPVKLLLWQHTKRSTGLMKNISLKQLRYFEALSRTQHFGKAANLCAVTQPALSMQIRDLERQIGVALLERTPAGALMTAAGEELAERARHILHCVEDLNQISVHGSARLSGTLTLGIIPTVAPYVLPEVFEITRKRFPHLSLVIREALTDRLIEELTLGRLDLIIVALPLTHGDLETLTLFDDRFVIAAPRQSAIDATVLSPIDLLTENRVFLLDEGHCFRDQALDVCRSSPTSDISTFGAASLSTIVRMVGSGMGITLLPELSLPVETRGQELQLIRFKDPVPQRQIGLAWRKSTTRSGDFNEFADVLRVARKRIGSGAERIAEDH